MLFWTLEFTQNLHYVQTVKNLSHMLLYSFNPYPKILEADYKNTTSWGSLTELRDPISPKQILIQYLWWSRDSFCVCLKNLRRQNKLREAEHVPMVSSRLWLAEILLHKGGQDFSCIVFSGATKVNCSSNSLPGDSGTDTTAAMLVHLSTK